MAEMGAVDPGKTGNSREVDNGGILILWLCGLEMKETRRRHRERYREANRGQAHHSVEQAEGTRLYSN